MQRGVAEAEFGARHGVGPGNGFVGDVGVGFGTVVVVGAANVIGIGVGDEIGDGVGMGWDVEWRDD